MGYNIMTRPIMAIQFLLMLLTVGFPGGAAARDRIVSVQSISIPPYEEAIDGFRDICTFSMDRLLISEERFVSIPEQVRRMEPDLILAVGLDALNALSEIHDIPIVFVMLLCPESKSVGGNVTGVNMTPSVDVQLVKINEILPDIRNVGVIFDPAQTGPLVQAACEAGNRFGIDIHTASVKTTRDVPARLLAIRDEVQLIWMIPDITVVTQQTIEYFLLFSLENKIPLIAFSEKYVRMGAFMAFSLDPEDMGRQAGKMANMILDGKSPGQVPVQDARSVSVTVSRSLAKKFGIRMDEGRLGAVRFVE